MLSECIMYANSEMNPRGLITSEWKYIWETEPVLAYIGPSVHALVMSQRFPLITFLHLHQDLIVDYESLDKHWCLLWWAFYWTSRNELTDLIFLGIRYIVWIQSSTLLASFFRKSGLELTISKVTKTRHSDIINPF